MKTKLSPKQRLEIYEMMVPIFELEHPTRTYNKAGFCWQIYGLFDDSYTIGDLIELTAPNNYMTHWYPVVATYERDDKRCEVLYKAIEDVLTKIK